MKDFKVLNALGVAVVLVGVLNACANGEAAKKPEEVYAVIETPTALTLSGNYLAGRFAQRQQDWNAAQSYMGAVVDLDSDNALMTQRAFLLSLGAGEYVRARELAEKVTGGDSQQSELAHIFLICDALSREDHQQALDFIGKLPEEGFGDYTKPLLTAWALVGLGKKDEAQKILAANAEADDPSYRMHVGLIEEMSGNMDAAAAHYKVAMENGLTLHGAVLVSRFFERYGHPEVSQMIFDSLAKLYPFNPFVGALSGDKPAQPNIRRAADGAAYAMFDIATLLYERKAYDSAQIYGSLVELLMPKSPFTLLMMGDIAAIHKHYDRALVDYEAIRKDSPIYWLSRMRIAEVYEQNNDIAKAKGMLTELSQNPETRFQALVTLGDIQRRNENFVEALKAYDEALTGLDNLTEEHWPVVYARGMSLERLNNWERAEKDLLKALEFQPDNPMILNFIGYSWADKGKNLDKALDYIRRAVALRPHDGYILDSYGWALYRSGDSAEAIEWLEKAVAFVPDDSTILDHLGDAYWSVGRHNEAKFQWKRAMSSSKDTAFKSILGAKLRDGIEKSPSKQALHKEANL